MNLQNKCLNPLNQVRVLYCLLCSVPVFLSRIGVRLVQGVGGRGSTELDSLLKVGYPRVHGIEHLCLTNDPWNAIGKLASYPFHN